MVVYGEDISRTTVLVKAAPRREQKGEQQRDLGCGVLVDAVKPDESSPSCERC